MSEERRLTKVQRQERILAALRASASLRVTELAETFGVSGETIRRDLDELDDDGLLNRTYGGAAVRPLAAEPSLSERYNLLVAERERIGALAARHIRPGQVVMIDAGSTTIQLARHLAAGARDLTVITNSFGIATVLASNPTIAVTVCPGRYDAREGAVSGPEAAEFLHRFNANVAAFGASGLTADGPNEVHPGTVWVKRAMIARAQERLLLADHSKFDAPMLEVVCPLAQLTRLYTDAPPPAALARALAEAGVTVQVAPVPEAATQD